MYEVVREYKKAINYSAGESSHYKEFRVIRDRQLTSLVGIGRPVKAFLVIDCEINELQIQEVLETGIINIYSFESHKKITVFAPSPERIYSLYEAIGEVAPDNLVNKSEDNYRRGYNSICKI